MGAPEFPKNVPWLNTERPLSLSMLQGHVVLLDLRTKELRTRHIE